MKKICDGLFKFKMRQGKEKFIYLVAMVLLGLTCFSSSGSTPLFMFSSFIDFGADVHVPDRPRQDVGVPYYNRLRQGSSVFNHGRR